VRTIIATREGNRLVKGLALLKEGKKKKPAALWKGRGSKRKKGRRFADGIPPILTGRAGAKPGRKRIGAFKNRDFHKKKKEALGTPTPHDEK